MVGGGFCCRELVGSAVQPDLLWCVPYTTDQSTKTDNESVLLMLLGIIPAGPGL